MAKQWARAFYKSKVWQDTRAYIFLRDKGLCVLCGMPGEEVHHIIHLTEENIADPRISINPGNLELLCGSCHKNEHITDRAAGHIKHNNNGLHELNRQMQSFVFDANGQPVPRV